MIDYDCGATLRRAASVPPTGRTARTAVASAVLRPACCSAMTPYATSTAFSSDDPSRDTDREFDHFTDKVLDELIASEAIDAGVSLPDISATLSHRKLSVAMCVEADA